MVGKKTFIGYDLGDGETITDLAVLDAVQMKDRVQTLFTAMTMPDCNDPGKAIPTVFGYDEEGNIAFTSSILATPEEIRDIRINFKRCPSDLIPSISDHRKDEIAAMLENGWPNPNVCPELNSIKMREFCDAVIRFTNAIFNDEIYKKRVHDAAIDSDEIVFCVGHPTRWSEFDVAVYSGILKRSVLGTGAYAGLPTSMVMAAESRAAFLYVRDKATTQVLQPNTCALLIDVGSSTIDLTAMTSDSRNHQYNSGSNYLGARSVDFIIRQWYLDKLRKDEEDWNVYQTLIEDNPAMEQALTLSCRMAKESVYSTTAGIARINFADFRPAKITKADINKIVGEMPIGEILRSSVNLPAKTAAAMGQKDWKKLFEEFLQERKAEMTAQGIKISRIIMTGSASKMPFVPEIVSKVFNEVPDNGILNDMNPSRSISMGLALVGPSNETSADFQKDLEELLAKKVPEIIDKDMPKLAADISGSIEEEVRKIVKVRILQWREGKFKTLEDMMDAVKMDCSGERLSARLKNCPKYTNAVENWTVNVVAADIALELKAICERYGVSNLTLDNLNVLKVSTINVDGVKINPADQIINTMSTLVTILVGIISVYVIDIVLAAILMILYVFATNIAIVIAEAIALIPGGAPVLILIAGAAVVAAFVKGQKRAKDIMAEKIQKYNLPIWTRSVMNDRKIDRELAKINLKDKIEASLLEEEPKKQIVDAVTKSLSKQIKKRAEDIKYIIESK